MTYFYQRQAGYQSNHRAEQFNEEVEDSTTGSIEKAQKIIYNFFLEIIKFTRSEEILYQFEKLFIKYENADNTQVYDALGEIIFYNKCEEFEHTVLRCCYILNNNWVLNNNLNACKQLVDLFLSDSINIPTKIYKLQRLRHWLQDFVESEAYQTLRSLSGGSAIRKNSHEWKNRFATYLLVSEYTDPTKSLEQRQYAKTLSHNLKKQFKFDLAMYTARIDSRSGSNSKRQNPTNLGDGVLTLIKKVLNKQGNQNYRNLAKNFFKQARYTTFGEFKERFILYLGITQHDLKSAEVLDVTVVRKLRQFQEHRHDEETSLSLLHITCNRTLQYLLLNERRHPSKFFELALDSNNLLTPVILLLKIVLIFPDIRLYLESYVAELIKFYGACDESECLTFINFLDVLNVTLAIFDEDTDYSLIRMDDGKNYRECPEYNDERVKQNVINIDTDLDRELDNYRVFSQSKKYKKDAKWN